MRTRNHAEPLIAAGQATATLAGLLVVLMATTGWANAEQPGRPGPDVRAAASVSEYCEQVVAAPVKATFGLTVRSAVDDFEIKAERGVQGLDIAFHDNVASRMVCAEKCAAHPGHVPCRSFEYEEAKRSCKLRHANKFKEKTRRGVTGGVSLPRRDLVEIRGKTVTGRLLAVHRVSSSAGCADLCGARDDCEAFVYKDRSCTLKKEAKVETGWSPGYVSGIKKSSAVRSRKVRALYVLPPGEQAKPNAEKAIVAILGELQRHYLEQLGVTFELAQNDLVTHVRSTDPTQTFADIESMRRLILSVIPEEFLAGEDIVLAVFQGGDSWAGGSGGIAKMTGGFWNTSYRNYENGKLRNSPDLQAWSHEFGHALGLRHHRTTRECVEGVFDVDSLKTPPALEMTCLMQKRLRPDTLYGCPLTREEKSVLLDPGHGDPNGHLALLGSPDGRRPHPSVYLGLEEVSMRTRKGAEDRCVRLPESIGDGTDTLLGSCGSGAPRWTIHPDGHISSTRDRGQCLDAEGPSYAPGTPVQVWSCKQGQPNQLWRVDRESGTIRPQGAPGVCVKARSDGAVRLEECDGSLDQAWSIQRPIVFRSSLDSRTRCIGATPGGRALLQTCVDTWLQRWVLAPDGLLHNAGDYDQCLWAEGSSYDKNTRLRSSACSAGNEYLQWSVDAHLGLIRPKNHDGRCVAVSGGKDVTGRHILLKNCDYESAQRWFLY